MTTVYDQATPLTGTDDGDTNGNINYRQVLATALLSAASGAQCQLVFRWGTAQGTVTGAMTSVWFGQSGATDPNFAGDQVQVKFGGASGVDSSPGGEVTSDIFTLAQNFNNTKKYTCAFHVLSTNGGAVATATVTGAALYGDGGAADSSSQTTPSGLSILNANQAFFLEKVIITAAVSGAAPLQRPILFRPEFIGKSLSGVSPFRVALVTNLPAAATIISGTWSSTGTSNAPWVGIPVDAQSTQRTPALGQVPLRSKVPPFGLRLPFPQILTGGVINAGTWSAVGSGGANWTGAAIGAAAWSSAGIANDAIWIGASTAAATWSSSGSGAASWVGTGVLDGVWSSAGTGAATWVGIGISIASGVWSSAGTANDAIWTGASIFSGIWSASGIGAVPWTGAATAASLWSSAGIADAPWIGSSGATQGALSAEGLGSALWVGVDATPPTQGPGGAGYVISYTRKRHRERIEELEAIEAALLAKAEKSKAEQRRLLVKAATAAHGIIDALWLTPEESEVASLVDPVIERLQAASAAMEASKTRAAVMAQTTAIVRYAELILEELEEEEAEMLLFFN